MQFRSAGLDLTIRTILAVALAFGLTTLAVFASHAGPTSSPTPTATPTPEPPCDMAVFFDKKCSVGGSGWQDTCIATEGEEVTYHYLVEPIGGYALVEVDDDKLGVIGQSSGETLTRTTTLTETTTNWAGITLIEIEPGCFCVDCDASDQVTVAIWGPTPSPTPTVTPTATPTATPTPICTPGLPCADVCKCQVKNIFPGGTVANLRLSGKPTMTKALGAEINAVDAVEGSNLCPDDPEGPYETAEAVVEFLVMDEAGNVISNGVPQTVTCVSGVKDPVKAVVQFGPENCGPDGFTVGVFDIYTSVSGEAGNLSRTQRIRCRP